MNKLLIVMLVALPGTSWAQDEDEEAYVDEDQGLATMSDEESDSAFSTYLLPNRKQIFGLELEARGTYLTGDESKSFLTGTTLALALVYSHSAAYSFHLQWGEAIHDPVNNTSDLRLKRSRYGLALRFHVSPENFGPVFIEAGLGYVEAEILGDDKVKRATSSGAASMGFGIEADFSEMFTGYLAARYIASQPRTFAETAVSSIGNATIDIVIGLTTYAAGK